MSNASQLPQSLFAGSWTLLKEQGFDEVSIFKTAVAVFSVTITHAFSVEKTILELAFIFWVVLVLASETVKFLVQVLAVAGKLVIFAQNKAQT